MTLCDACQDLWDHPQSMVIARHFARLRRSALDLRRNLFRYRCHQCGAAWSWGQASGWFVARYPFPLVEDSDPRALP